MKKNPAKWLWLYMFVICVVALIANRLQTNEDNKARDKLTEQQTKVIEQQTKDLEQISIDFARRRLTRPDR